MREAGQLKHAPCLWCETLQITEERLKALDLQYKVKLEFEYFHCAEHAELLHNLIGPDTPRWSCCKEQEPGEAETALASQPQND